MTDFSLRETLAEAIRYWECGRLLYNAVLALILVIYFFLAWPASKDRLSVDLSLSVFLLAVLANAAYCSAFRLPCNLAPLPMGPVLDRPGLCRCDYAILFSGVIPYIHLTRPSIRALNRGLGRACRASVMGSP